MHLNHKADLPAPKFYLLSNTGQRITLLFTTATPIIPGIIPLNLLSFDSIQFFIRKTVNLRVLVIFMLFYTLKHLHSRWFVMTFNLTSKCFGTRFEISYPSFNKIRLYFIFIELYIYLRDVYTPNGFIIAVVSKKILAVSVAPQNC